MYITLFSVALRPQRLFREPRMATLTFTQLCTCTKIVQLYLYKDCAAVHVWRLCNCTKIVQLCMCESCAAVLVQRLCRWLIPVEIGQNGALFLWFCHRNKLMQWNIFRYYWVFSLRQSRPALSKFSLSRLWQKSSCAVQLTWWGRWVLLLLCVSWMCVSDGYQMGKFQRGQ